jgi:multidrug efflux pump subunit AcrB
MRPSLAHGARCRSDDVRRRREIRLTPILMTTLRTLFGLLPLALGLGAGAELQKPLALAVIGGLSLSTFITLLAMPVLCSLLEREKLAQGPPRLLRDRQ